MALSGQITVTTAGTAVQGPAGSSPSYVFVVKAHPDNTDTVWVGNVSNAVTSANGYPLNPGEALPMEITDLSQLWFNADVNGEKICWIRIG